jgi:hypothetical protein
VSGGEIMEEKKKIGKEETEKAKESQGCCGT